MVWPESIRHNQEWRHARSPSTFQPASEMPTAMSETHSQSGRSIDAQQVTPGHGDGSVSEVVPSAAGPAASMNADAVSQGLRSFGNGMGMALTMLGAATGAARMLDIAGQGAGDRWAWAGAVFHFVSQFLGFAIAGSAVAAVCHFAAALLPEFVAERAGRPGSRLGTGRICLPPWSGLPWPPKTSAAAAATRCPTVSFFSSMPGMYPTSNAQSRRRTGRTPNAS